MQSYAGLSEAQMVEPGVVGDWSVKDVLAHVTTWEEEALTHLPHILAGETPPRYSVTYGGVDAFNALMTERKRELSLEEVLRQLDETHARLMAYVRGRAGGTAYDGDAVSAADSASIRTGITAGMRR